MIEDVWSQFELTQEAWEALSQEERDAKLASKDAEISEESLAEYIPEEEENA